MEKCAVLGLFLLINFQIPKVMCFTHVVGSETDQRREPHCYSRFDYEYKVVQKIVALENLCEEFKTTNNELRDEIQDLKDRTEERPKVAFLAVMESTVSLAEMQTVVFDSVVTNVGNGYDASDGIFAADYSGLYQFSASIMAEQGGEVWTYIRLNEKRVAMIYARASDQRHDQGANSVILQLQKGDRVSVVNQHTAVVYGGGYSSFSGTLL